MIRPFKTEDLDDVIALWLETNIKAHDFIESTYWHSNMAVVKNMLPQATVYVYVTNNKIQGFIGLMAADIAGIFVAGDVQSQGIGKALLDEVKTLHAELSLSVYKKNEQAMRFYLREGFVASAEQLDGSSGEMAWRMIWKNEGSTKSEGAK